MAVVGQGSERILAAVAHGAIAFGFVGVGFLASLGITAVIWLTSLKSSYVRQQSDRAGRYQIFVLLVNILAIGLWALGLGLLIWLTGWRILGLDGGDPRFAISLPVALVIIVDILLLASAIPVFAVWYVGTILYGVYGAAHALAGHDFHYPPPPWARRRRQVRATRVNGGDDAEDDELAGGIGKADEPQLVDALLERKLKWED